MRNTKVRFYSVDRFNRPIFKDESGNYYGATDKLVSFTVSREQVLGYVETKDLTYFGRSFDCEPMGTKVTNLEIVG